MNVREQIFLTVLLHPKPLHLISINVATSAFNRWCNGHQAESFQTARDQVPFFTEKSAHLCLVTPPLIKTAPGDIVWIFHSALTLFFICPIPKGKGIYVSDQRMKSTQDEIKNVKTWIFGLETCGGDWKFRSGRPWPRLWGACEQYEVFSADPEATAELRAFHTACFPLSLLHAVRLCRHQPSGSSFSVWIIGWVFNLWRVYIKELLYYLWSKAGTTCGCTRSPVQFSGYITLCQLVARPLWAAVKRRAERLLPPPQSRAATPPQ